MAVNSTLALTNSSRCWAHLEHITEEHRVLLERTPAVQYVQSAWLILLHCAAARANYLLRVVRPAVKRSEENHDAGLWRFVPNTAHEDQCEATTRTTSTMPFGVGWDGTSERNEDQFLPAFWANWGDCLHMVHQKHPCRAFLRQPVLSPFLKSRLTSSTRGLGRVATGFQLVV